MLAIDLTTISVLLIVTLAAFVRATVGFGDALIAMSLLVSVIGLETATPLVGLTGVSTALLMLTLSWQKVDLRSIAPFLAASAVGIPLGALLLTRFDGDGLIIALGVILVAFGVFKLTQPHLARTCATLPSPLGSVFSQGFSAARITSAVRWRFSTAG